MPLSDVFNISKKYFKRFFAYAVKHRGSFLGKFEILVTTLRKTAHVM